MYQRILVPVDDSETSHRALDEAIKFAQDQRAKVRLISVVDLAQFSWGGTEFLDTADLQASLRDAGRKTLQEAQARLKALAVEAETQLVETWGGRVANLIVQEAASWQADIIVMGTHGWSGLDHLILGSVAEGVVRISDVPILMIRSRR
ncbi:nucleotide-binding universal stress UspA family protein [Chitinivorax tropicus]|uniref:Universal stress protein n=1 Tax=Chitinivorax tropicus TaxID=714531 RepID=A0A840MLH9_9PROT|nr:universal stress protein [Chitinivorax tropicus]MBB5020014.1 nucleotide-binding universal stress UspA family protein [Chitinivorax tropicus]